MNHDLITECKTDLLTFTKTLFQTRNSANFIENYHHKIICEKLEKIIIGDIQNLIINIPPRYGKTELAVINFIAWAIGIFPDSQFIHTSYSKRLATKNCYAIRDLVMSDTYKKIFPHIELRTKSKAKDEWQTTLGGVVYAVGSEGTITGYGAGKLRHEFGGAIIIDDPHKAAEISSSIKRTNIIDWFQSTILTRRNSPNTPIIVIMQRLHIDDLSGYLLKTGGWETLKLPVIEDNKPLWPVKHTLKDIEKLKKNNAYIFAGQYMQNPSPLGGGLFKDDWWRFYEYLPQHWEYTIITADTAQKTAEYNDYSVFQCWGKHLNNIYLIDQMRGKWEAPELKNRFILFRKKFEKHNLRNCYIEDKASGTGLIQDLKKQFPIKAIPRYKDKVSRAMDAVPYIEAGFVHIPKHAEWIDQYLSEFSEFTPLMSHKHDDQIDPTLDAIDIMLRPKQTSTW